MMPGQSLVSTAFRKLAAAGLTALLFGCGPSDAAREAGAAEKSAPSSEELRRATHPDYVATPDARQECLGRLVFDVRKELEWGLSRPGRWSGDRFRFTENMHGPQDYVLLGNVEIVVLAPAKWADIERMLRGEAAEKSIAIDAYREKIETLNGLIADFKAVLQNPALNINNEDLSGFPASIERFKQRITDAEASIAGLNRDWQPLDLGLPQSLGYAAGPTLYAFLLRDGRAFRFMATGGEGEPPFEERKAAFLDLLKRFQTRALYQIPRERGICIPYGFIPDDGAGHFRTEVSFRYKDRPGVIYSLGTAVVGERDYLGETAMLTATARSASSLGSGLVGGREAKVIAPRPVKIGALEGWQGGVSLNVADRDKPAVRSYSVYAGYDGRAHSRVLPGIRVNMRSFTQEQEDSLKTDPPPLEESQQRFETVLKSIRLRPTVPAMPELAGQ
jgi:hypothetical protein